MTLIMISMVTHPQPHPQSRMMIIRVMRMMMTTITHPRHGRRSPMTKCNHDDGADDRVVDGVDDSTSPASPAKRNNNDNKIRLKISG